MKSLVTSAVVDGGKKVAVSAVTTTAKSMLMSDDASTENQRKFSKARSAVLSRTIAAGGVAKEVFFIKGKHVREVVSLYYACFPRACYPELDYFTSQADPTQGKMSRFFLSRRFVNNWTSGRLSDNETLHDAADAAIYNFFKDLQGIEEEIIDPSAPVESPKALMALIVPRVVDTLTSLEPNPQNNRRKKEGFGALLRFCADVHRVILKYYKTEFWFSDKEIIKFLNNIPRLLALFATERNQAHETPRIDEFVSNLLRPLSALAYTFQLIAYKLVNAEENKKFMLPPSIVGQKIRDYSGFQEHSQHQGYYFEAITANPVARLIVDSQQCCESFGRYSNALLKASALFNVEFDDQERLLELNSSLRHMCRHLHQMQRVSTTRLNVANALNLTDHGKVLKSRRFPKKTSKSEKRRIEIQCRAFLELLDKATLGAGQLYSRTLLLYNAVRTLEFYSRDLPAVAVGSPQVKDCCEHITRLMLEVENFSLTLNTLSNHEALNYLPQYARIRTLYEYGMQPFIPDFLQRIGHFNRHISTSLHTSIAKMETGALDQEYAYSVKLFHVAMQLLLAHSPNQQYTIAHLERLKSAVQSRYAGITVMARKQAICNGIACAALTDPSGMHPQRHARARVLRRGRRRRPGDAPLDGLRRDRSHAPSRRRRLPGDGEDSKRRVDPHGTKRAVPRDDDCGILSSDEELDQSCEGVAHQLATQSMTHDVEADHLARHYRIKANIITAVFAAVQAYVTYSYDYRRFWPIRQWTGRHDNQRILATLAFQQSIFADLERLGPRPDGSQFDPVLARLRLEVENRADANEQHSIGHFLHLSLQSVAEFTTFCAKLSARVGGLRRRASSMLDPDMSMLNRINRESKSSGDEEQNQATTGHAPTTMRLAGLFPPARDDGSGTGLSQGDRRRRRRSQEAVKRSPSRLGGQPSMTAGSGVLFPPARDNGSGTSSNRGDHGGEKSRDAPEGQLLRLGDDSRRRVRSGAFSLPEEDDGTGTGLLL